MARVLIVDDDQGIADLVDYVLTREGHETRVAPDGESGIHTALEWAPDIIILDIMLPGIDGFDVVKRLRVKSATPILMLTARGHDPDKVRGLDVGADDYVTKPFSPTELAARVRALVRRGGTSHLAPGETTLRLANRVVDLTGQRVVAGDAVIALSKSEAAILRALVAAGGSPLSPIGVIRQAFGYRCDEEEARQLLKVHVHRLRRKIEDDASNPRHLVSVRGSGYRLVYEPT